MKKLFDLNGKELALECNAASPIVYKRIFGGNLMQSFQDIIKSTADDQINLMEQVVFTFNVTAKKGVKEALNASVDDYIEFLAGFDIVELANNKLLETIVEMWNMNIDTSSILKNQQSPLQGNQP